MLTIKHIILLLLAVTIPCFGEVNFQPGVNLIDSGKYDDALVYFEEHYSENKADPDFLYYYAVSQYRNDHAKDSIKTIKKAIEISPNNPHFYFALSMFYLLRIGEVSVVRQPFMIDDILDPLKKASELDPTHSAANSFYIGWLLNAPGIAGGDIEAGKARLPDVEKLNKTAWLNLQAGLAQKEERFDDAENFYLHAIESNKQSVSAHMGLASFYLEQGKYQQAIDYAKISLTLKRHWSEAGTARDHLIIAQALHHQGDTDNSKKEASLALAACWNKVEKEEIEKVLKNL